MPASPLTVSRFFPGAYACYCHQRLQLNQRNCLLPLQLNPHRNTQGRGQIVKAAGSGEGKAAGTLCFDPEQSAAIPVYTGAHLQLHLRQPLTQPAAGGRVGGQLTAQFRCSLA